MSAAHSAKKRKRSLSDAKDPDTLSLQLSDLPDTQIGPVLAFVFDPIASFPCLTPPINTTFNIFVSEQDEGKEFVNRPSTIVGETPAIEFSGSVHDGSEGTGSKYFLALHRPGSSKLVLQPAPVYLVSRHIKAHKSFKPTEPGSEEHFQARSMLGKVFGTKKAKAAINAYERNRVDVNRIDEGTENLPTQEKMEDSTNAARLIPAFDADAKNPEDIYPLYNIISELEWAAMDSLLPKLKNESNDRARARLLPNARSDWLQQHLMLAYSSPKPKSKIVKILIYASVMFTLLSVARRAVPERTVLLERLAPAPEVVVDGLLARFTETPRGSTTARMTSDNETNLLTHLFALCLRVDEYATETTLIAADLKMSTTKVNSLFRSLGCTIGKLSSQDLKRLGLPDSAGEEKRAILKVPLTFPKPRAKRRA
ncbi:Rpa49 subunit specific to nuclear RNA polymerase I [Russula dissimulans]|nr:Rpa49 subunit specific to nuclear RNA polymerase I [Russula dissimulans]